MDSEELYLFLTRVFTVAVIMALSAAFRLSFPFLPGHMTLLTLLTVGIPTFGLALFAPSGRGSTALAAALVKFVLPSVVFVASAAFSTYAIIYVFHDLSYENISARKIVSSFLYSDSFVLARDGLTYVLVLCGLWLVVFAAPPTKWFAVVERTTNDWRPTILAITMLPLYALIVATPSMRGFFGLNPLEGWLYLPIAIVVTAWMIALRYVWANGYVERVFASDVWTALSSFLPHQYQRIAKLIPTPAREKRAS